MHNSDRQRQLEHLLKMNGSGTVVPPPLTYAASRLHTFSTLTRVS